MKNRYLISGILGHFLLSLGGFLGLNAWLVAAQDGGVDASGAAWVAPLVDFALLQPLAHWVLAVVPIAWWTWPGLLALTALVALNSALVAGLVLGLASVASRRAKKTARQ